LTLIVEDGSGMSTAESYVSAADASTYFAAHGGATTAWTAATSGEQEAALRYARVWMDARYMWPGSIMKLSQALEWPRYGAFDSDGRIYLGVPQVIKDAQCELAKEHLNLALNTPVTQANFISSVSTSRSEGGDTDSLSVSYNAGAPVERDFTYVDRLLSKLTGYSTGNFGYAVRA
jgi:hypothetical protein